MKKIVKIIDYIYWGLIIITTLVNIVKLFSDGSLDFSGAQFSIKNCIIILVGIFIMILVNFINAIFKHLKYTIIYLGVRIGIKKFFKDKLDKIDLEKYKDYYRDIIEKYSMGVLNYIDNFTIDKNTVIATLMNLELKGIIDNNIQIINEDTKNLDKNEIYIYNNIKNNNLKNINLIEFERQIVKDCLEYKLLKEKLFEDHKAKIISSILTTLLIITSLILPIVRNNPVVTIVLMLLILISFITLEILRHYNLTYFILNRLNPYIRTKEAQNINEKLEGLKNYLQEYSNISNRTEKELIIWEDYLIYSVIFNQNTNLIEEYNNKISNM